MSGYSAWQASGATEHPEGATDQPQIYESAVDMDIVEPRPSCLWYSPPATLVETGTGEVSPKWRFTAPQTFHSCCNPRIPSAGCSYSNTDAPQCHGYAEDPVVVLGRAQQGNTEFRLERQRMAQGRPVFALRAYTPNALGVASQLVWQVPDADDAHHKFAQDMAERNLTPTVDPDVPVKESFFAKLVQ